MTAVVDIAPAPVDDNIRRSVRALMGWHNLDMADIAKAMKVSAATAERRLALTPGKGRVFYAREVQALSEYFGQPVESFHKGTVVPAESFLTAAPGLTAVEGFSKGRSRVLAGQRPLFPHALRPTG